VRLLRQAATPDYLLGRMSASSRFFTSAAIALGALPSGFLGEVIGPRPTLLVGALGLLLSLACVVGSPLPRLRQPSELPGEAVELRSRAAG